jgi:pimeloyl-ACP methyl ester carboxylesterase
MDEKAKARYETHGRSACLTGCCNQKTGFAHQDNKMNESRPARKKLWRWVKGVLIGLATLLFILVFIVLPYMLSWFLTHARSRPSDRVMNVTPEHYGIAYQNVKFTSADGTPLAGWWLPAESSRVAIIYCHGLFRSRLELLERAALFQKQGYAGLLFDFRRHGESGGELTSAGYLERQDVLGAVRYLRDSLNVQQPIVVCAVSMGTAAAMLAAAETPEIAGLILDSSFLSFDHLIAHHAKIWLGLPRFPIADEIILFTKWRAGFTGDQFDMRRALEKIGDRPMLFIAGSADVRMPPEISQQLYQHSPSSQKKLLVVDGAKHGAAFAANASLYERAVLELLKTDFSTAVMTHTTAP